MEVMLVQNDGSNEFLTFSEEKEELYQEGEEDDAQFITDDKAIYVPDSHAFIDHYNIIRDIMKEAQQELCYAQRVVSELDGLAKSRDFALADRKSLRLLVEFNNFIILESFLDYI